MTDALILHHYDESPFAEKIRALLGYKGLTWKSVRVPMVMPKPDLIALTGSYRRVPVLQIGSDIYCDTRLITEEIERRFPEPTIATAAGSWGEVIAHWVDKHFFLAAVNFTFSQIVDFLDDAFLADRAALFGLPKLPRDVIKQGGPMLRARLSQDLGWIETALSGGQEFVHDSRPGHGDFALYCALWFARVGRFDFAPYPCTLAWMKRIKGFGHGQRTDITPTEAIEIAAQSTPSPVPISDESNALIGKAVIIQPDGSSSEKFEGTLVAETASRWILAWTSPQCGKVHLHYPKVGYRIRAA